MKALRWLAAGLVWTLAGLMGVIGVLPSVTKVLLPVGIPVLLLARRLFVLAVQLVVPRSARHPVQQAGRAVSVRGHFPTEQAALKCLPGHPPT